MAQGPHGPKPRSAGSAKKVQKHGFRLIVPMMGDGDAVRAYFFAVSSKRSGPLAPLPPGIAFVPARGRGSRPFSQKGHAPFSQTFLQKASSASAESHGCRGSNGRRKRKDPARLQGRAAVQQGDRIRAAGKGDKHPAFGGISLPSFRADRACQAWGFHGWSSSVRRAAFSPQK